MVLTKRAVNPPQNQTTPLIQGTKNLVLLSNEQYTNVGIIEQLTSFFEYSSSIFNELLLDIEKSSKRIQELSSRVYNATLSISGIEQTFELANTGDNFIITNRIDFNAQLGEESSLFPKQTNTQAINKMYDQCFKLPPLEQLDPYREDNQSCLKLYSNPNFFIEAWIQAQKEKIAKDKEKREERRQKRAERRKEKQLQRTNTEKVNAKNVQLRRDKYKEFETNSGDIQSQPQIQNNNLSTFQPLQQQSPTSTFGPPPSFGNTPPPPPNFGNTPPPPPNFGNTPPPPPNFGNTPPPPPNFGNTPPPPPNFGNTPPPPPNFGNTPPPPPNFGNTPPPPPQFNNAPPPPQFNNAPPPPPQFSNAPPPPQFNNAPSPPPPPSGSLGSALSQIESSSGGGGGLLDQIKKGVNLKKQDKPVEKEILPQDTSGFNTNLIAMVLNQRREALEDSDEDSDDSAS